MYRHHVEKVLAAEAAMLPRDVMLFMRKYFKTQRYDEAARIAAMVAPHIPPRPTSSAVDTAIKQLSANSGRYVFRRG